MHPIPPMSAAGSERVNVTQRKFRTLCAAKSLSSTITMSGNLRIGSSALKESQKRGEVGAVVIRGALDDEDTGQTHPRATEAIGQSKWAGSSSGSDRRAGPAAAITTFDPWFNPCPE